jgi:hypothetical protein
MLFTSCFHTKQAALYSRTQCKSSYRSFHSILLHNKNILIPFIIIIIIIIIINISVQKVT